MDILEGPDAATLVRIREELGEDEERFEHNLKVLEEWMSYQSHLPQNYDRRMLPIFLRACKHDLAKTKKKLEDFFGIKASLPEIFENLNPDNENVLELQTYAPYALMPKLTPEGCRVTVSGLLDADPNKFDLRLLLTRGCISLLLRTVLEKPISGDVLVYDAANITSAHAAAAFTPLLRKVLLNGPEAFPNRIREIHIVNASVVVERIVAFVKPLLKEKLRNRFFAHTSCKTLLDHIPGECLPSEYGGTAPSVVELTRLTHDFTMAHRDWLAEQKSVKLIGPLPERYRREGEGSFRRLQID